MHGNISSLHTLDGHDTQRMRALKEKISQLNSILKNSYFSSQLTNLSIFY